MRYPRAARGWGPFLPYYQESPSAVDDDDEQDEGGEEMDSDGGDSYYEEQGGSHGGDGGVVDSGGDAVKRVSAAFRIPSHLMTPEGIPRERTDCDRREYARERVGGVEWEKSI